MLLGTLLNIFLKINIRDDELLVSPEEVGTVLIPCKEIAKGKEIHGWFDLDFHGRPRGKIKMSIQFFLEH